MEPAVPRSASPALVTWLAVAGVLAVMALTLGFVGATQHTGSGSVCEAASSEVTVGECLVAVHQSRIETDLVVIGSATLGAGAAACLVAAVVATVGGRRR